MSTKTNLIVDAGILGAFLVAMQPRLTGISTHEWLSVALAGTVLVHLLLHWKWITAVLFRFFKKLFHKSRLQFVIDLLLFAAFVGVMTSGLLISRSVLPALNIQISESFAMRQIHSLTANASLALVGLHFAMNWRWVVSAVSRYGVKPIARLFHTPSQPAGQPTLRPAEQSVQSKES